MSYPFWCCGIPTKITRKHFCDWWRRFNAFVSTCTVNFCTAHRQNKTGRFDTECSVPVARLCGIVGSLSWFTKCLIFITGNILPVMNMNEKCIYSSENRACTIIQCAIVLDVCHITSTWPFISWWYVANNYIRTPRTERPPENPWS